MNWGGGYLVYYTRIIIVHISWDFCKGEGSYHTSHPHNSAWQRDALNKCQLATQRCLTHTHLFSLLFFLISLFPNSCFPVIAIRKKTSTDTPLPEVCFLHAVQDDLQDSLTLWKSHVVVAKRVDLQSEEIVFCPGFNNDICVTMG